MVEILSKRQAEQLVADHRANAEYQTAINLDDTALEARIAELRNDLIQPSKIIGMERKPQTQLLAELESMAANRRDGVAHGEELPSLRASAIGVKHLGASETMDLTIAKAADADVTERAEALTQEAAELTAKAAAAREAGRTVEAKDLDKAVAEKIGRAGALIDARDHVRVVNTQALEEREDSTHQQAINRLAKRDHKAAVRLAEHYGAEVPPAPPRQGSRPPEPDPLVA